MPDVLTILTQRCSDALRRAFGEAHAHIDPLIRASANPSGKQFGDYQVNLAMSLAKVIGQKPRDVAEKIVTAFDWQGVCEEAPTIAGPGFINLRLARPLLEAQLADMAGDERLGVPTATHAETVVVDYSGPNVAKEMHIGHFRATVIGDALARVLEFQGHQVIRQNHLGDWGTQFGMLIEHLVEVESSTGKALDKLPIADLNELYRAAKKRFDEDAGFADRARKRVVALQAGDEKTLRLWRYLIDESKRHFNAAYQRLGIKLTDADVRAESFYNPLLPDVADELESSKLAVHSDGALCVFPPGYQAEDGRPVPVMVRKSDGGYGYDATDLAALRFRIRKLGATRIVYVTDSRQKQHFAMVFAVAKMAGWLDDTHRAEHVAFGTILGEDGKPFKSRSGDTVKLADLLDEARVRAIAVIARKNSDTTEAQRETIASAIGIGAIKYADLSSDRIKDYVFNWDRMLSFDGNTAPYLINAYVRIKSIFRKAGTQTGSGGEGLPQRVEAVPTLIVADSAERALALKLLQYASVIESVAQSLEPHRLCTFLYELASLFHQFYEKCPVLTAPDAATRDARLALCNLVASTLKHGLDLLGIQVIEQM
ncbi:MAG: arginine--tRNA ligase [Phycisphaeraceae bacterium]|nr:arginine--tRNA ligase [Phycisphaeraceae bacterium]